MHFSLLSSSGISGTTRAHNNQIPACVAHTSERKKNIRMLPVRPGAHARDMTRGDSYGPSAPPHHLFFLLIIALVFLLFSWYMSYESTYESVMDQLKLFLMASPVLILLAVHWLSAAEKPSFPFANVEANTIHRAGSSPWGVGLLLVFLMFVISYQSELQERTWFPVWRSSRRYY